MRTFPLALILLAASVAKAEGPSDDPLMGTWRIIEADFSDHGHCMVTDTIELVLTLRRRGNMVVGEYVETNWRDTDFGQCPGIGGYRISYSVRLRPDSPAPGIYVADLKQETCRHYARAHCRDFAPQATKRLEMKPARGGVTFGGIFLSRDRSAN